MKREILTVPFVQGIDQGNEEPQLTDKALRLENAVINRHGAVDKRFGKTQLSGSYSQDCIAAHDSKLVVLGDTVQVMDSAGTMDTIATAVGLCDVSSSPVLATEQGYAGSPSCAVYGDMVYVARSGASAAYFDAYARSTGAKLQSTYAPTSTGVPPRLVYVSAQSRIYAIYINASSQLCVIPVLSDGSRGTVRNLATSDSWPLAIGYFDAVGVSDTKIMVAYKQSQSAVTESNTVATVSATKTITAAGGIFAATDVGRKITLSGSGSGNDGTYTVATYVNANNVTTTEAIPSDESAGTLDLSMEMSDLVIGVITVSGSTITGTSGTLEIVRNGLSSGVSAISACRYTSGEAYFTYYQDETTTKQLRGVSYTSALAVGEADHQLDTFPSAVTGTNVSLTLSGTTVTLVNTGDKFTPGMVGLTAVVSGATNPGNNGSFTIASFVDRNTITYSNASGVTESGAADLSITPNCYLFQAACVASADNDTVEVYYTLSDQAAGHFAQLMRQTYDPGGMGDPAIIGGDVSLWGKPVVDSSSRVYIPVHHSFDNWPSGTLDSHQQRSYVILRDDIHASPSTATWPYPVARYFPTEACEQHMQGFKYGAPQALIADGTDKWLAIGVQLGGGAKNTYGYLERADLHLVSIDVTPTWRRAVEAHHELLVPNSAPYAVASGLVYEVGPLTFPEKVTGYAAGTGSGFNVGAGSWGYRVVYEVYAGGVRYESAPSPVVAVTTLATHDSVWLTIPTLKMTRLSTDAQVRIVVYRSSAAGNTSYLRIGTVANDPDATHVLYEDGGTANTGAEQEYTANGTILQNDPPFPVGQASCVWQQRLFFSDPAFPDRLIRYSKEFAESYGPSFSSALYFVCSPEGGDITALAALGDRLVIFKRSAIFATNGLALNDSGAGAGYADPQLVSPAVGCVDARSVVKTPRGIMFESDDCIFLLDPGLNLSPIGRPVKHLTSTLTIADSCTFPDYNIALFVTDGVALVYNYLFDMWTTWANMVGSSCAVANGVLYIKDATTGIWKYDTTTYLDDGATLVALAAETAWIQPGGTNALNRVWEVRLLGHSNGARTVRVKIAYDHDPYWIDTLDVNTTDLGAFGPTEHYGTMATDYTDKALLLRFRGSRTKCSAIRFRIEEVAA